MVHGSGVLSNDFSKLLRKKDVLENYMTQLCDSLVLKQLKNFIGVDHQTETTPPSKIIELYAHSVISLKNRYVC